MAATVTKLQGRRRAAGLTMRVSIDAFLDSPKINRSTPTRRALHWREATAGQG